MSQQRLWQG
ncbi:succinylglutamic semialdehyde dehydrogenase, partial [Yersinia pestis PY-12]